MPGRLEFEFGFKSPAKTPSRHSQNSFNILLLADLTGVNQNSDIGPIVSVDVDNFDSILVKLAPQIDIVLAATPDVPIHIKITNLDDFHPDSIYTKVELFKALRETRDKLANPDTFAAAAATLQMSGEVKTQPASSQTSNTSQELPLEQSLFESLVGGKPVAAKNKPTVNTGVQTFIQEMIAPHVRPDIETEQTALLSIVDNSISELMRAILHNPDFQQLEATWRSIDKLISRVSLDEDVRLYFLDIGKTQLHSVIEQAQDDLTVSPLYQRIVAEHGGTLGGQDWSVIIGDYYFDTSLQDAQMLAALGAIAQHCACSFIAAADNSIVGCTSVVETPQANQWQALSNETNQRWLQLRSSPYANAIGLVMPRILQRLPYGASTNEIDGFKFEEIETFNDISSLHSSLLWGNGAIMCALLLAKGVEQFGLNAEPGVILDIENLPAFTYAKQGVTSLYPCAEAYLTETTMNQVLAQGVMCFGSFKNQNKTRLLRFQSIADPAKALNGPW